MSYSKKFNKATYDGEDRRHSRDSRKDNSSRSSSVERRHSANRFTGVNHKEEDRHHDEEHHSPRKHERLVNHLVGLHHKGENNEHHSSKKYDHDGVTGYGHKDRSQKKHHRSPKEYCRSDMGCDTGYYGDDEQETHHWRYHCRSCGVERKVSCGKCKQMVRPEHYCCKCGTFCQKASMKAVHKYEEKVSVTDPCGKTDSMKYTREESLKGSMHQHHSKESALQDKTVRDYNEYADKMGLNRITKATLAK